jgi:hypothetical protein
MGNARRHLTSIFHQLFDLAQHPVDGRGKLVEIIACPADRNTFRKISSADAFRGPRQPVHAGKKAPANHHTSGDADEQGKDESEQKHVAHRALDGRDPVHVGGDGHEIIFVKYQREEQEVLTFWGGQPMPPWRGREDNSVEHHAAALVLERVLQPVSRTCFDSLLHVVSQFFQSIISVTGEQLGGFGFDAGAELFFK